MAQKNKLLEMAESLGYSPGEFAIARLAVDSKRVSAWIEYIDRGVVPDDLLGLNLSEARRVASKESAAIMKEERAWADFFHPKLRAQDVTIGNGSGGPLRVEIVRHSDPDPK